jgi:hypothetical protein
MVFWQFRIILPLVLSPLGPGSLGEFLTAIISAMVAWLTTPIDRGGMLK